MIADRSVMVFSLFSWLFSRAALESTNSSDYSSGPIIITTWARPCFQKGTEIAWQSYKTHKSRLQALVDGCSYCERVQCDGTIGFGGSPDETGRVTLDALVMDGPGHRVGAVAQLSRVKEASRVAWAVMNYTKHTLLAGERADDFALQMNFKETRLTTNGSIELWKQWAVNNCQPNFRQNVSPDPLKNCGPYNPGKVRDHVSNVQDPDQRRMLNHDTVGMLILDETGDMSAATSTNGAIHKIPGRVSDAALTGAGAYVDNEVGSAAATGDGDVMQRFLPSFRTVENMRHGMDPNSAAEDSVRQIVKFYSTFQGAVIALDKRGRHGAACYGWSSFAYSVRNNLNDHVQLFIVNCVD